MSKFPKVSAYKFAVTQFWEVRTEQERRFLGIGGSVAVLALVYATLIDPAFSGRAQLHKDLPGLRQEAADIQALARQAGELASQPAPPALPMSRESLSASLAARGLTAQSISMTGEYAKLQLSGVSYPGLSTWLDAQRREARIEVQEATFAALPVAGQVDASITLRQGGGEAK